MAGGRSDLWSDGASCAASHHHAACASYLSVVCFPSLLWTQNCEVVSGPGSRFKGKHSLDSDEEDEGDDMHSSKYDILASDDVEGTSCLLDQNCQAMFRTEMLSKIWVI